MCVNIRYINSTRGTSSVYLWWSLCPLRLHACLVRVTVGDSGLSCCACVNGILNANWLQVCWFCTSALGLVLFQICNISLNNRTSRTQTEQSPVLPLIVLQLLGWDLACKHSCFNRDHSEYALCDSGVCKGDNRLFLSPVLHLNMSDIGV